MPLESSCSSQPYFFSHVYIKMQGPSPCQKLKFKLSSLLLLLSFRFNQDHSQPNLIWNYKVSCHTMQLSRC